MEPDLARGHAPKGTSKPPSSTDAATVEGTAANQDGAVGFPTHDHSDIEVPTRVLRQCHFETALREVTASSSETSGSASDLRKWNEEFGEGGKKRGQRMWGGRFGFILDPPQSQVPLANFHRS